MNLISLEASTLTRYIQDLENRIDRMERLLSGEQLGTAKFADASITNAKITSLVADKITTGDFIVAIDIGNPASGYLRLDGANNRFVGHNGTTNKMVMGQG